MKVIAKKGAKCPMEGAPRTYISDSTSVDVAESAYYLRRLRDGSLIAAPSGGESPLKVSPAQKEE